MQATVVVNNKEEETGVQQQVHGTQTGKKDCTFTPKHAYHCDAVGSFLHKAVSTYKHGSAAVCLSVCHSCAKPVG